MSTSDLFTADYPHGTVKGFDGLDGHEGCRGGACPGGDLWGLTCKHAKQLSRSDYQYQKLAAQGLGPAEIADKLGLIPTGATTPPVTKRAPKPKAADHAADTKATKAEIAVAFAVDETVLDGPDDNLATQHDATATTVLDDVAQVETELGQQTSAEADTIEAPAQPTPKEIRAWARDRGYEIKPMGKIPQLVLDHYWETHELGSAPVDTNSAPVDTIVPESATIVPESATIVPESATIVPESAGPRPEWGYVALTEDLARAQTERDALAEELEDAKDQLTRARALAARLEEELARAQTERDALAEEHATEISALHVQLSDNHNGDRQRIEQLEEALALAEGTANADDTIADLTTRLAAAEVDLARAYSAIDGAVTAHVTDAETIRLLSGALELTLRKWAAERERSDRLDEVIAGHEWANQYRRDEHQRRIDQTLLTSLIAPATPDDDGIPRLGLGGRIRRGWAATR